MNFGVSIKRRKCGGKELGENGDVPGWEDWLGASNVH